MSSNHNHDDRYYTESEIDTKLNSKVNTSDSRLTDARTPKFNLITASASNIVDLDTYKTGGFYYTNSDVNYAPYIIHCPWSNGTATPYTGNKSFFLLVETWGTTSNYVKQTLTYYTNNTTFTRTCSNGTWSTWAELSKNGHNHNSLPYVNTILAGEALTNGKIIGAKSDGKYYNLASELELDTTYPIYKVFGAVNSGSASNQVDFFNQTYAISGTKSMTLTGGKPVYIEGRSYGQGKFRVSGNIVTQTLTEGYFYINIGTAYDTANIRLWLADNTVHYYDGEKLVPCTENNYNTGGTNLIPNSQEFTGVANGTLTGETYKDCNIRRIDNTSGTSYVDYTWSNLPKIGEFKQGDVFTLSFWAKGTGQLVAYNYGNSGYMTSRPIRTNGTPSATYGDGNCYFTLSDEWKRYYVTWVLNPSMSDTALTVSKTLLLRTLRGADSYVCGVMYERGDTAHDWSPSPNDLVKTIHSLNTVYINDNLELCYNLKSYYRSYTNNEDLGDLLPSKKYSFAELTTSSNGLKISSGSGEKWVFFPVTNFTEIQFTYVSGILRGMLLAHPLISGDYIWLDNNGTTYAIHYGSSTVIASKTNVTTATNGDIFKITISNTTVSFYRNNELLCSGAVTDFFNEFPEYYFGFYTNVDRNIVIKDLIIK